MSERLSEWRNTDRPCMLTCPAMPEYLNMKADEKCPGASGASLPCEEATFLKQHPLNLILCTEFGRREREREREGRRE